MTGPHPTAQKLTEKNIGDVLKWITDYSDGELNLTEAVKDMAQAMPRSGATRTNDGYGLLVSNRFGIKIARFGDFIVWEDGVGFIVYDPDIFAEYFDLADCADWTGEEEAEEEDAA
jgi:hypothetical protein